MKSRFYYFLIVYLGLTAMLAAQTPLETWQAQNGLPTPAELGLPLMETKFVANDFIFNQPKFALLQEVQNQDQQEFQTDAQRKSGIKAALFSAVLPGAGEVYTKSYLKAALFIALEIGFWTTNIIYENKGDVEDVHMKAFGDAHWSERRYWSKVYEQALAQGEWSGSDPMVQVDENNLISDAYYTPQVIAALRGKEAAIGYTHGLPTTKTQQYYEMIYKYLHQFGVGWDDAPSFSYYDDVANLKNPTPNISQYRSMRNRSNSYYETATNMVELALLNHLISALDAAWSARQFNNKVKYSLEFRQRKMNFERVNMYGLNISW